MKRLIMFVIVLTLVVGGLATQSFGQQRNRKKGTKGLLTNLAIVGGSTVAGALIGRGRNGAMIGAGAGLLYASSRKGTKRRYYDSNFRRAAKIGGGTLLGMGTGAWVGGKKGMIIGGLAGAGATYLYTRNGRKYYRSRDGRVYSVRR
ncbi:MAG: hypothetical protein IPN69_11755 [Acidobacteria bacterium]|nr:hypothetical protein [Acidobacteriota bacterium]MBK8811390.1 hypothetical protein [Acidobacteriota bacterium]